jgi:uncharacterized protein
MSKKRQTQRRRRAERKAEQRANAGQVRTIDNTPSPVPLSIDAVARAVVTTDSWYNTSTGIGGPRDKSTLFSWYPWEESNWNAERLSRLYDGDDMASRIVNALPDEAMRLGFDIRSSINPAQKALLDDKLDSLGVRMKYQDASRWARVHGQSAVIIGANDGNDPAEPLVKSTIDDVHWLHVLEADEFTPHKYQDDQAAPNFGEVSVYRISPMSMGRTKMRYIHASRLLVFQGVRTTKRMQIERAGSGASVLWRAIHVIAQFNGAFATALAVLSDSVQNIFKLKNLNRILAKGAAGQEELKEKFAAIEEGRSTLQAMLLDADNEEFVRSQVGALSGVSDIIREFYVRIAAVAETPITHLLMQSPAGLNATGESDDKIWRSNAERHRTQVYQPPLERLLRLIFAARRGPTQGVDPDQWKIHWPSLDQPSALEQAQIDQIKQTTYAGYVTMGVLNNADVARAEFSGDSTGRPLLDDDRIRAMDPLAELDDTEPDTEDEEEVDPALVQLVSSMNEQGIERCRHERPNRCPICGIEKVALPGAPDPVTGAPTWDFRWRPIGDFTDPNAPATPADAAGADAPPALADPGLQAAVPTA